MQKVLIPVIVVETVLFLGIVIAIARSSTGGFLAAPFDFIGNHKYGWLALLLAQAIYLTLDLTEAITEKSNFGLYAAGFMCALGFMLTMTYIVQRVNGKSPHVHSLFEGMFYLGFGVAMLVFRFKNRSYVKKEQEKEQEDEHEEIAKAVAQATVACPPCSPSPS